MKTNISTFQPKIDAETLPETTGSTRNNYQTFWTKQENKMQENGNKGTNGPATGRNEDINSQRNMLSNCLCPNNPFMEAYSRTVSK